MYSRKSDEPQLCRDCKAVLIQWRPNPDKIGQVKPNGKPYVLPYEVNTGLKHDCPVFKQRMAETQQTTQPYAQKVENWNTRKPQFTPNDQTADNILIELKAIHVVLANHSDQNNTMIEMLEILAGEKARKEIKPAQEVYQNNTAYEVEDPETTKQF